MGQYYIPKMIFKGIFIVVIGIAFVLAAGYVTMYLWNWLMTDIFGLRALMFWEAIGLLLLAKIFFGFPGGRGKCCGHGHSGGGYWKNRFKKKMANMSPEEKKKFMKRCWGYYDDSETEDTSGTQDTSSSRSLPEENKPPA